MGQDKRRVPVELTPTELAALAVVRKAIAESGHNPGTDLHRFTVAITHGRGTDEGVVVGTTIAETPEGEPDKRPASLPLVKAMARDAGRALEAHGRKLHEEH